MVEEEGLLLQSIVIAFLFQHHWLLFVDYNGESRCSIIITGRTMDHFSYIDRVASYILRTDNLIASNLLSQAMQNKNHILSQLIIAGKAINRFRIRGCVGVLKVKQYNVSNRCVVFYCCCTLSCCNIIVCGCS